MTVTPPPARGRPQTITRVHASALLVGTDRTVLVLDGNGDLAAVTPDTALAGAAVRVLLTRSDLLDAGVRTVPGSGGRLTPGSGPLVDELLDHLNPLLTIAGDRQQ
ncbi:hypothetical protein [Microbispora sp. H13382]|uniref:hypothetical protein n=1 Tax=Microbispora sp. H13382 TaxID=2729112 RepID=UPI0015FED87A|nr:hypothetical protein [Microbispora sp. H13382]